MINVGIVGYGNLGKALEKQIKNNKNFNLIAIFSRKNMKNTYIFDEILKFKEKIDLLFLCCGSKNDLEGVAKYLIKHFNIIDCYDNHKRLKEHIKVINTEAKQHKKIALCSLGWDPGILSLIRGLFSSLDYKPITFWGKGTSQGHTEAIKQIEGVVDAIQFTVPNNDKITKIKTGEKVDIENLHLRECFVVCNTADEDRIKKTIVNMPDYFKGYKTTVKFITQKELNEIKTFSHKGEVVTYNNTLNFSLNLSSNPDFTAKVLITYANSFSKLKQMKLFGAHTIFDIPLKFIIKEDISSLL